MDRVTFATSSGPVWLALAVHLAAGLVSIVAGTIALSVAKGGRLHKRSGLVFTWAMIVLGLTAAGIGTYENRPSQVFAGLLAAYLVFSAMATVKPLPGIGQRVNVALMVLAFGDLRAIRAGGLRGSRRLARHLWRMCFGLFVATGSFFLGQMRFIPEPVRIVPLLLVLAFAPILFLAYWMWRVRIRGRLSGIVVGATQPR